MMKLNRQSGFTLIEMVAVIIILAIMAATALPKFANLSGEARYSSLNGLVGGLRAAAVLSRSKWLAAQSGNLDTVDFNGVGVSVIANTTGGSSVANLGFPLGETAAGTGIDAAMDSWNTYASGADGAGGIFYWPTGVATSGNCYVRYVSGLVTISPVTADLAAANCA
jgi:MSHA pilin protein MshA